MCVGRWEWYAIVWSSLSCRTSWTPKGVKCVYLFMAPPVERVGSMFTYICTYIDRYSADQADGPLRLTNVSFACQKQLTSFASPPVRSKKEIMACLAFKNNLVDNTPLVLSQSVSQASMGSIHRTYRVKGRMQSHRGNNDTFISFLARLKCCHLS